MVVKSDKMRTGKIHPRGSLVSDNREKLEHAVNTCILGQSGTVKVIHTAKIPEYDFLYAYTPMARRTSNETYLLRLETSQ